MGKRTFRPNDGRPDIQVSSLDEIRLYMGEVMNDFGPIEVVRGNLVVTYLNGLPVTLGTLL